MAEIETTPRLDFRGQKLKCKCLDVYDGDTITIAIPLQKRAYQVKCRLSGIDCAELRTIDEAEKKAALAARDWVADQIKGRLIWVECGKFGLYNRLQVTVYLTEKDLRNKNFSLNRLLIQKGFAVPYDGRGKRPAHRISGIKVILADE